jgi:hypothetical protein
MSVKICEFTQDGIEKFGMLIEQERQKVDPRQPAVVDATFFGEVKKLAFAPDLAEVITPDTEIDETLVFSNRFAMGEHLHQNLPADLSRVQYSNVGLWAWISAVYIEQLLEPRKKGDGHNLWSSYRYIPIPFQKFRYYRHLAFMSFWMHRRMGEDVARFFLSQPVYSHSDTVEQMYTQDRDFLASKGLVQAAVEMYLDPASGRIKRNALGKSTPGSARRLATKIAKQLQMNYDLHSLTKDEVFSLLPDEFASWR